MSKQALIIIGGGILSCYAIRRAKELGFTAVCTDRDPACLGAQEADDFEKADVYSVNEQIVAALKLKAIYGAALKGIFCGGIDAAHIAASVAKVMGWPGVAPQAAWLCRRKDLFRQRMKEAGIRQPEFCVMQSQDQVSKCQLPFDKHFIIKSVENSGGRGHTVFAEDTLAHVDFTVIFNAAEKAAHNNIGGSKDVLIEELLTGREFSVEIVTDGLSPYATGESGSIVGPPRRWRHLNIVARYFAADSPYPIEVGHVNPAPITDEQRDKLFRLTEQCADAVQADFGPFKVDAIWPADSDEPYVLEATCRWSGGFDAQETTPISSGRDFLGFGLRLVAGESIDVNDAALQPRWQRAAASWCPIPPPMTPNNSWVLDRIETAEAARVPGVEKVLVMPFAVTGTKIEVDSSAARPVYVIASGDTTDAALAAAKAGAGKMRFVAR